MPNMKIDKRTGFVEFTRTPDERKMANLVKENESLKKTVKSQDEKINAIMTKLGLDGSESEVES